MSSKPDRTKPDKPRNEGGYQKLLLDHGGLRYFDASVEGTKGAW
jgi:hypothetical protein